jgi:transcriptional regulator
MYIPRHFAVDDPEVLERVVRENGFGILISQTEEGPFASHLPMQLKSGVLLSHMAKANPHWKLFDGSNTLCIFSGPHAYVSPQLYVTTPNVPTWNYVTVHAYGVPRVVEEARAREILELALTEVDPDLPRTEDLAAYIDRQLAGIVAFEIAVTRMEGKFKLSQNKKPEDREAVIAAFSASDHGDERAVAHHMRQIYGPA